MSRPIPPFPYRQELGGGVPRALAGITLDGLSVLTFSPFTCDPAQSAMTLAFWTRTARVIGPGGGVPGSSFGEIIEIYDPLAPGGQIEISTRGAFPVNGGSPGGVEWVNDPITNYRIGLAAWPGFIMGFEGTPNDDLWMFQLMSFDITPRAPFDWITAYINGQFVDFGQGQQVVGPNTALGINGHTFAIGGTTFAGDTDFYAGEFMNLWVGVGVDLREPDGSFSDATIGKFMGAGNRPLYLGDHGELVTGAPADVYCSRYSDEPVATFLHNKGTAGGPLAVVVGGPVTTSTTPNPSGEPRPIPISCNVTGSLAAGDTLTVHPAFTFAPASTNFQWWTDNQGQVGLDQATYVLDPLDVGGDASCAQTVTNATGSFISNSVRVGPIVAGGGDTRITQLGDVRVTSTGDTRITA